METCTSPAEEPGTSNTHNQIQHGTGFVDVLTPLYRVIVGGLGHRLLISGMGVHRVTTGGAIVHSAIGAREAVWEAKSNSIRFDVLTCQLIRSTGARTV